jgi:protein-disulfide isomerase
MSGTRERDKRREARLAAESQADPGDRRTRLLQLAAGAAFLVIAVVLVLIVIQSSSSGDGGDTQLEGVQEINQGLQGIPQSGMTLGDPGAPVELVEFADLQCPFCKAQAEEVLPSVIEGPVAQGKARVAFRNFTIIGEQSVAAGAAALAAGAQGRGWNFVEIFYRNQGPENSGYADDEFLTAVARAAGVKDIAKWNSERSSAKLTQQVEDQFAEAERLGFTGTPSYAIQGPVTDGLETLPTPDSSADLESAIAQAS